MTRSRCKGRQRGYEVGVRASSGNCSGLPLDGLAAGVAPSMALLSALMGVPIAFWNDSTLQRTCSCSTLLTSHPACAAGFRNTQLL